MPLDPVETLQRLIQTPSVNPMGRECTGLVLGESRMTALLASICREQGWPHAQQTVHPGRDNLLALIQGHPQPRDGGQLILWDVHQDTVPVEGMSIDPFAGEVRDGRVYGRGACDVKGSMAAMLAALSRVQTGSSKVRPTILLACTANEECGFTGSKALAERWNKRLTDQFFHRPDVAIAAEPTQFNVVVAHQGQVRWRCHTIGQAAHTSRPDMGVNAIYAMSQVVQAIERYHAQLSAAAPENARCGRPCVCVSTITGGVAINTVPERAMIEIDRRLSPDESPATAYEQLIGHVATSANLGEAKIVHDPPFMQSPGLSDRQNHELADQLTSVIRRHGRAGTQCGVPYGTDAAALAAAGVPTVVFGPGSIDQAHTADEFIEIKELELATEIFYDIACNGLR